MSVLDLLFWWMHIEPDEDSAPEGTLTAAQQAYVMARPGAKCERKQPGCGIDATHIDLSDKKKLLQRVHRHPDSPDSWVASCDNCVILEEGGGS